METTVKIIAILILMLIFFILGQENNQQQIEERALTMNQDCYNGSDLGFIIKNIKQP